MSIFYTILYTFLPSCNLIQLIYLVIFTSLGILCVHANVHIYMHVCVHMCVAVSEPRVLHTPAKHSLD